MHWRVSTERNTPTRRYGEPSPIVAYKRTHGACLHASSRRSPLPRTRGARQSTPPRILGLTDEGEAAGDDDAPPEAAATEAGVTSVHGPKGVPRYEPFETEYSRKKAGFTREWFAHLVLMSFIIAFLGYTFYIGASVARRLHPPAPPPPPTRAKTVQQWLSDVVTLLFVY